MVDLFLCTDQVPCALRPAADLGSTAFSLAFAEGDRDPIALTT